MRKIKAREGIYMNEYSEECILTFLKNQGQLFSEPVAETEEEAEAQIVNGFLK